MPEGRGYERLKPLTTVEEILAVAIEFERTARDFYTGMIPKVSKRIRWLVEELAGEEQAHLDMFTDLTRLNDLTETLKVELRRPASDHKFSNCVHLPVLGRNPDDQAILQYALMREHAAMEQYTALAETAPEGPVKTLFRFLADEETRHKTELEKLYYQLVHVDGG